MVMIDNVGKKIVPLVIDMDPLVFVGVVGKIAVMSSTRLNVSFLALPGFSVSTVGVVRGVVAESLSQKLLRFGLNHIVDDAVTSRMLLVGN